MAILGNSYKNLRFKKVYLGLVQICHSKKVHLPLSLLLTLYFKQPRTWESVIQDQERITAKKEAENESSYIQANTSSFERVRAFKISRIVDCKGKMIKEVTLRQLSVKKLFQDLVKNINRV